jgi:hypothetical protein
MLFFGQSRFKAANSQARLALPLGYSAKRSKHSFRRRVTRPRRIAANIAKLPELLRGSPQLSEA